MNDRMSFEDTSSNRPADYGDPGGQHRTQWYTAAGPGARIGCLGLLILVPVILGAQIGGPAYFRTLAPAGQFGIVCIVVGLVVEIFGLGVKSSNRSADRGDQGESSVDDEQDRSK